MQRKDYMAEGSPIDERKGDSCDWPYQVGFLSRLDATSLQHIKALAKLFVTESGCGRTTPAGSLP